MVFFDRPRFEASARLKQRGSSSSEAAGRSSWTRQTPVPRPKTAEVLGKLKRSRRTRRPRQCRQRRQPRQRPWIRRRRNWRPARSWDASDGSRIVRKSPWCRPISTSTRHEQITRDDANEHCECLHDYVLEWEGPPAAKMSDVAAGRLGADALRFANVLSDAGSYCAGW